MTNGVTLNTSHTNNVIKNPPFNCYLRPVIRELMKRSLWPVSPGKRWRAVHGVPPGLAMRSLPGAPFQSQDAQGRLQAAPASLQSRSNEHFPRGGGRGSCWTTPEGCFGEGALSKFYTYGQYSKFPFPLQFSPSLGIFHTFLPEVWHKDK